jgi:hypothetical protein
MIGPSTGAATSGRRDDTLADQPLISPPMATEITAVVPPRLVARTASLLPTEAPARRARVPIHHNLRLLLHLNHNLY